MVARVDQIDRESPSARLGFGRTGMLLHAVQHMFNQSRVHAARTALLEMIEEHPTLAMAHAQLGVAARLMGDAEAAIRHHERALELNPHSVGIHSSHIFTLDQSGDVTLEQAYRARRAFNAALGVEAATGHENDRDPDRPLRVGYVSGDFRYHSAMLGWAPVILAHTRRDFELYGYSTTVYEHDGHTARLCGALHAWRDAADWDDDRLEAQIREDRIDVLIDLSGHSVGNRLRVFARKPAPIQVTAFGYITGTGLDAIDYLFADDVTIRPDEERWYAEEIVRLPRILTSLSPDFAEVGDVPPPPFEANGHLTFGVFNRLGKIQPPCARAWAAILRRLPEARLFIKAPGLDDAAARDGLEAMCQQAGMPLDRLVFAGLTAPNEHLKTIATVDLNLDTSPHGGGMTTLDAAWMGVPTLTLPHIQIPSRIATTINRELGLDYLVAESWDDYVARAVALDGQRAELARVRRLMRDMMSVSAFGDHVGFTRAYEARIRELWRRWCAGEPSKPALRVVS